METIDQGNWGALKAALDKEARSIFCSMGQVVLIEPSQISDRELVLYHRSSTLKITFVPERDEVQWKKARESGCGFLTDPVAPLAAMLVSLIMI